MRRFFSAVLSLCAACGATFPTPVLTDEMRQIIDDTNAEWVAAGLARPSGNCLKGVRVVVTNDPKWFAYYCGAYLDKHATPADGRVAAGCLNWYAGKKRDYPLIVVNAEYALIDTQCGPICHETIHRLSFCVEGDADSSHSDVRLWSKGGPQSVQHRTAERLKVDFPEAFATSSD